MSLNFIKAWRNDKWYNKRVLIWGFTLVLIKINYGQTGLFYTTNPVFYSSGNRFVRRTGTFGNLWFFHLSRRTTVIQDLLVRRQFSLVPDNWTNVNIEVCLYVQNDAGKLDQTVLVIGETDSHSLTSDIYDISTLSMVKFFKF